MFYISFLRSIKKTLEPVSIKPLPEIQFDYLGPTLPFIFAHRPLPPKKYNKDTPSKLRSHPYKAITASLSANLYKPGYNPR